MTSGVSGQGGWGCALPGAIGWHLARLHACALIGVWCTWLATRIIFASTAGGWAVVGGSCQVLAWGLVAGVIAAAASQTAGREQAGWVGVLGTVACEVWQHRLPSWFAPDLVDRLLGLPLAGVVRPPSDVWHPRVLSLWTSSWAIADILWVVVVGTAVWRRLARATPARVMPVGRSHVSVAVACVGVLAATMVGLAGVGIRLDAHVLLTLFAALGLDLGAGLLGEREPWSGPQRLGVPPETGTGQWEATSTILSLAAITITICLCVMAIADRP